MASGVMRSVIRKKSRKTKPKSVKKSHTKKYDPYAGYSRLTDHPLPHVDHGHDLMDHISREYKMMR